MKKIVIDPVTRIGGHLRVEAVIDENNIVQKAFVSGQLFRSIETILKGRHPDDAGLLAQRTCGVCTNVHYRASISAVENACEVTIPHNAEIVRDLVTLSLMLQDHVVHFYQLHLLDFVDVSTVLDADVKKAIEIAFAYDDTPLNDSYNKLNATKEKVKKLINIGRLGPFRNAFFSHPAMRLSPEENLLLMTNYLEALKLQRELSKAIAIFAGKVPTRKISS